MPVRTVLHQLARRLARTNPQRIALTVVWLSQAIDAYATDNGRQAEDSYNLALDCIASDIQDRIDTGYW